jgi:hypothetical protein
LLERDEDGRYRIGLRLWEIATSASRAVHLREDALPFLQDLYDATHENVHFAVLDNGGGVPRADRRPRVRPCRHAGRRTITGARDRRRTRAAAHAPVEVVRATARGISQRLPVLA